MRLKHPRRPEDLRTIPENTSLPPFISEDLVHGMVLSFPTCSAGGCSGLRPQHLKDTTAHKSGSNGKVLLTTLTAFVNKMLKGDIPQIVQPIFCGASLTALTKKMEGQDRLQLERHYEDL